MTICASWCAAALAGCATSSTGFVRAPDREIVWPQAPDVPRVRYLGMVTGDLSAGTPRSPGRTLRKLFLGPEPEQRLITPHAVAVRGGQRPQAESAKPQQSNANHGIGDVVLAIADTNGRCVHVLDLRSHCYTAIGHDAATVALQTPVAVAFADDRLCVADAELGAVFVEDAAGPRWRQIGQGQLVRPAGLAYNPANQLIYVSDAGAHGVFAFEMDGTLVHRFGARGNATGELNYPAQIAVDSAGNVVVADALNFRVQRFGADGTSLGTIGQKGNAGGDFAMPKGVAVDGHDHLWVVDSQFENVQAFDADGRLLMALGGEGQEPGEFWLPAGAAVDGQNRLWIADTYNRRIQVFQILP